MSTIVSPRPFQGEAALPRRAAGGTLSKVLLACGILSSLVYVVADVLADLRGEAT